MSNTASFPFRVAADATRYFNECEAIAATYSDSETGVTVKVHRSAVESDDVEYLAARIEDALCLGGKTWEIH
jgi:hypothetical protein